MIKARRIFKNLHIEVEAPSVKELVGQLSNVDEVLGEKHCGMCQSEDIRFVKRVVKADKKSYTYYEMRCGTCGARLQFGQSEDTENLFPKRKTESGKYDYEHKGWAKYNPNDDKKEE